MIVYSGNKSEFISSVVEDKIAKEIEDTLYSRMHKHVSSSEIRAWENSMQYMHKVLADSNIPDNAGIAIEFNIPQTSKRVDFIISGYDETKNPNVIVIELKQWQSANKVEKSDSVVETYLGGGLRRVVHPSYQAWSYVQLIKDYNETVQKTDISLHPCAYLHNYSISDNDPIIDGQYKVYLDEAPVYAKGDVVKLREFIKKYVKFGDNTDLLYQIDHGKIKPSKSLQDAILSMVKGNDEFTLIDDQRVVYEDIVNISKQCQKDGQKRTIIVKGGPGTGKTVLAVNLLARLTKEGQVVQYTSKNAAPRNVYLKKLHKGMTNSRANNLFKGSGVYFDVEENTFGTLIADEAHRLNEKSGFYGNQGENQIKEIIHASLCNVFFIDEFQRVTLKDIGSISEIEKWAKSEDSEIIHMELLSQFRCNGSDGYLAWVNNVLGISDNANYSLEGINFDFQVCDTPQELREKIIEKNKINNKSRILAGYCWEWPSGKGRNDTNVHDIKIGDFEISWNLNTGEDFAIAENSINEAGCIHTTQGLEFDYVGVIIGEDLRFENGNVITDFTKRANTDQSIKGIKGLEKENPSLAQEKADEIIKNTYRVLMTRGMKGCYIYCCDKGLAEYIKGHIE